MFRKSKSNAAEPTVVGRGAVIEGTVRAQGRVQVDGRIEGTLEVEGEVSVGPSGSIQGRVIADELAIGGHVTGKITARAHLRVLSGGSVRGEIRYGTLEVDRGGVLHGNTTQGDASSDASSDAVIEAETALLTAPAAPPPLPAPPAPAGQPKVNSVFPPAAC